MEISFFKNQARFRIAMEMIDKEEGISILQLAGHLEDISQATLYRHVKAMLDDQLIKVVGVQKLDKGEEKLYALNTEGLRIEAATWNEATVQEKADFITYYFMYVLQAYKNYHETKTEAEDRSTFSVSKLNLSDDELSEFESELSELIMKYYQKEKREDGKERTVSLVIVP